MRIFVAGASGVLGRAFVRRAVADGHEVVGMTRSARGAAAIIGLAAAAVRADAFDREAVMRVVGAARPDAVVHLLTDLASGDSASNARIRTEGTRNLIDAAKAAGVDRVIAESISWVYPPGTKPASEAEALDSFATEPRLTTIRGVTALEDSVREMPEGVVLRFGQLYGPGTWYAPDGLRADAARAGTLPATQTVTSFVHVEDAAEATLRALRWPARTWNIVDDEPAAATEWVPVFACAVGGPRPVVEAGGDIGRPVSNARARAEGWEMLYPSWRDGFSAR
ncbi:NAD(P)-dependent oxidoreductase [Microbacterium sp. PM5]|uniref:NAD-dependent epimerase/dehydratase family protein n=1 Tax=Microbacterium sp. PM5 TaxID=2014534 RepID=UPI000DD17D65|nr:NAD(P)-dependent oxidoreductase [Microbacterium sp. PM5]AXA96145.1 dTDP-glucose 4,6-dehydratase [Microbacterium sp. PM5]